VYKDTKDRQRVMDRWIDGDKEEIISSILAMDKESACYCTGVLLAMLINAGEHYEAGVLLARLGKCKVEVSG
jgi:putative Ca2+/H+ antiporter (TMEM165/GDT1 family)